MTDGSGNDGPLLISGERPVRLLTLNRPERLNAVSLPMYRNLLAALEETKAEPAVRALVLTGAGRAFSVGADLKAHAAAPGAREARREYVRAAQHANARLQSIPKPVVAAVNGHAIGGGLELALSCDLILVAEDAKLRFPEVSLGTFLGGGVTYTLPARVGLAKARELVLLGESFSGEEAAAIGLAYRALPAPDVLPAATELAHKLAKKAPVSMRWAKRLLGADALASRRRALALEAKALLACMETRDWREGIDSFQEKREPRFTGE